MRYLLTERIWKLKLPKGLDNINFVWYNRHIVKGCVPNIERRVAEMSRDIRREYGKTTMAMQRMWSG
jgi:hypothetical protein